MTWNNINTELPKNFIQDTFSLHIKGNSCWKWFLSWNKWFFRSIDIQRTLIKKHTNLLKPILKIPTRKEKTTNHTTNQSEDPDSRFLLGFLISFILLIVLQNFLYFHGSSLESVEILGFLTSVAATAVPRLVFTSLTCPI